MRTMEYDARCALAYAQRIERACTLTGTKDATRSGGTPNPGQHLNRSTTYLSCRFFFFSSRRRHTRLQGDWSSDVCSSDLFGGKEPTLNALERVKEAGGIVRFIALDEPFFYGSLYDGPNACHWPSLRSEERRVGKECRSRWSPYH